MHSMVKRVALISVALVFAGVLQGCVTVRDDSVTKFVPKADDPEFIRAFANLYDVYHYRGIPSDFPNITKEQASGLVEVYQNGIQTADRVDVMKLNYKLTHAFALESPMQDCNEAAATWYSLRSSVVEAVTFYAERDVKNVSEGNRTYPYEPGSYLNGASFRPPSSANFWPWDNYNPPKTILDALRASSAVPDNLVMAANLVGRCLARERSDQLFAFTENYFSFLNGARDNPGPSGPIGFEIFDDGGEFAFALMATPAGYGLSYLRTIRNAVGDNVLPRLNTITMQRLFDTRNVDEPFNAYEIAKHRVEYLKLLGQPTNAEEQMLASLGPLQAGLKRNIISAGKDYVRLAEQRERARDRAEWTSALSGMAAYAGALAVLNQQSQQALLGSPSFSSSGTGTGVTSSQQQAFVDADRQARATQQRQFQQQTQDYNQRLQQQRAQREADRAQRQLQEQQRQQRLAEQERQRKQQQEEQRIAAAQRAAVASSCADPRRSQSGSWFMHNLCGQSINVRWVGNDGCENGCALTVSPGKPQTITQTRSARFDRVWACYQPYLPRVSSGSRFSCQ